MVFPWGAFATNDKSVVHCGSEDEIRSFVEYVKSEDYIYIDTSRIEKGYRNYENNVCFSNDFRYGSLDYCSTHGYKVYEWADFMDNEFEEVDDKEIDAFLKNYKLVKHV